MYSLIIIMFSTNTVNIKTVDDEVYERNSASPSGEYVGNS